jgi:serine/threonine-protein kinase
MPTAFGSLSMKTVGKYEIRGLLGKGGMGRVYKVRLPVIGKLAALKRLEPHPHLLDLLGEEELRRRFLDEARTMAGLPHPNVAEILDYDEADGRPFFVMEYYCNDLATLLGESKYPDQPARMLPMDKVFHYGRQMLAALARMHHAGAVHRDVKPANLLLTGENDVKLCDFGLSKLRGDLSRRRPDNLMVGSPFYAAPEQERNPEAVSPAADVYSAGAVFLRMVTGLLPTEEEPPSAAELNPDCGPEWDRFLERALATEPRDRFAGAREMGEKLEELEKAWTLRQERVCRYPESAEPERQDRNPAKAEPPLRTEGVKVPPSGAREAFGLDELWRPERWTANDFSRPDDDTVRDRATKLAWDLGGCDYPLTWDEAHDYVGHLNESRLGGAADWRLPTVPELLTLLERVPHLGDFCQDPIFGRDHKRFWSCDRRSFIAAWYVDVEAGFAAWQDFTCRMYARGVRKART